MSLFSSGRYTFKLLLARSQEMNRSITEPLLTDYSVIDNLLFQSMQRECINCSCSYKTVWNSRHVSHLSITQVSVIIRRRLFWHVILNPLTLGHRADTPVNSHRHWTCQHRQVCVSAFWLYHGLALLEVYKQQDIWITLCWRRHRLIKENSNHIVSRSAAAGKAKDPNARLSRLQLSLT